MHERVATVLTTDAASIVRAIAANAGRADLVEVRLDGLWQTVPDDEAATEQLLAIVEAGRDADTRLLATLRPLRQGGRFDGAENVRLGLLVAAARAGFHRIDLECDNADMGALLARLRDDLDEVMLSDHTLPTTPEREEGLRHLLAMQDLATHAEKLAFATSSFLDVLRAIELAHAHAHRAGRPAITPLGSGGARLRALLALTGNRMTYGYAHGEAPAVSGQPGLAAIEAVWEHWGLASADLDGAAGGPDWFAVLGGDVSRSLSPRIHNAALRRAGRSERFGALDVPDSIGSMRLVANVAHRLGLRGASVTAPLKGHALQVAEPDELARDVGAANCLCFDEHGVHATNTDAQALARILAAAAPDHVAVLGAGGAARAALHAARELGVAASFASRDPERARQVARDLEATWVPWQDLGSLAADAWVQATPLGTDRTDPPPLDATLLNGARTLVEMVYASGPTPLQRAAAARGMTVHDGRTVLLEQAVDAYRFWTGQDPDRTAMQEALQ